jgi:hypothetical protein
MVNILNFKPIKLEDCLIDIISLNKILTCNFNYCNVLLRGRSGVGKTLICKLIKQKYTNTTIIENIENFNFTFPVVATTTNLLLDNDAFDMIIDILPLSRNDLLKKLSILLNNKIESKNSLYDSIHLYYPNINKILTHYINEN